MDVNGLDVTGAATLNGLLDVSGGFTPSSGSFTVFTAASINDLGIMLTPAADLIYDMSIMFGTDIVLTVTGGSPTDPDGNGLVNGLDLMDLQRNNPSQIPQWRLDYGGPPSASSGVTAIPEPSCVILILAAVIPGTMVYRTKRRGFED